MGSEQKDKVHGEGNYEATRQYNEATKKFVESGRVEKAAREAAPKDAAEAADMKRAEEAALLRAKGKAKPSPIEEPEPPEPSVDDPNRDTVERDAATTIKPIPR